MRELDSSYTHRFLLLLLHIVYIAFVACCKIKLSMAFRLVSIILHCRDMTDSFLFIQIQAIFGGSVAYLFAQAGNNMSWSETWVVWAHWGMLRETWTEVALLWNMIWKVLLAINDHCIFIVSLDFLKHREDGFCWISLDFCTFHAFTIVLSLVASKFCILSLVLLCFDHSFGALWWQIETFIQYFCDTGLQVPH